MGSGVFIDAKTNEFDALVVDEVQIPLNVSNLGENQIKEVINAAKFSVSLLMKIKGNN